MSKLIKLQTRAGVRVEDEFAALDGRVCTDLMGYPIEENIPGFARVRVTSVGSYWSEQWRGCSGYYVELEDVGTEGGN